MRCPPFMWHIKGAQPGPTVVVLGGTHGTELTGIATVQILAELFGLLDQPFGKTYGSKLPASKLVLGELYLGFGNPEAILRCTRSASNGADLNRSFLPTELSSKPKRSDRADLKRAREIRDVLATADFLLDIHSVSLNSAPFLCSASEGPAHRGVVGFLPTPWFLSDPNFVLAQDLALPDHGTTDSWVNRHGGVGLCYESGLDIRTSDMVRVLPAVLMTLTHKFRVLVPHQYRAQTRFRKRPVLVNTRRVPTDQPKSFFKLTHCEIATEREFAYAPEFTNGWTPAVTGQVIGTYGSGKQALAPHDGMWVLPRSPARVVVGQHLFFMAVPA